MKAHLEKTRHPSFRMSKPWRRPGSRAALYLGLCLMALPPFGAEGVGPEDKGKEKPASREEPVGEDTFEYSNWLDLSLFGVAIDGDNAAFMKRQKSPPSVHGGVEDFHFEQFVGEDGLLTVDGRAILDHNDYLIKLGLESPEKGYLRGGFREFRTWYDGSGGFFPQNGAWFDIFDDELTLDRGEAWFEAGFTPAEGPQLTFKYTHLFRNGEKNSLSWGDTTLTGGFGVRGIVPSFREIDEERDIFEGEIKGGAGGTDWGIGLRYEKQENDNSLNVERTPEENSDRFLTQREKTDTDLFNLHAYSRTRLSKTLFLSSGASYTSLEMDLSGSRIYGSTFDPVFDPSFTRQSFDEGFLDLSGNSDLKQFLFNLNLMATLKKNLTLVTALRLEKLDLDSDSDFIETNFIAFGNGASAEESTVSSARDWDDYSGSLDLRYTGLQNWVFTLSGFWSKGDGELTEKQLEVANGRTLLERDTDNQRMVRKYAAGVKWYPLRRLHIVGQYYHKSRDNDYNHLLDSTLNTGGNRFPAFLNTQDFTSDDLNFRITWRPRPSLNLVSRYDYQFSTVNSASDGLSRVESARFKTHIFSATATWTPLTRFYLQGGINYVSDELATPANDPASDFSGLVLETQNDYWNGTLTAGWAVNGKTDLKAEYYYYRADDYADNSAFSQPFGANAKEQNFTLTMHRRISENLRYTLKYGFYSGRDGTSGGHNDYDAHLFYSSLQYRF